VRLREIKAKVDKRGNAHDRYQNALAVKDVVKVLEGPCKVCIALLGFFTLLIGLLVL